MPTLVLDAYSKAFPSITNRIRASVSSESSPLAPIATIIDSTAGHPARMWHFPGLPRDNYKFSLDEIDGAGNPLTNLALFDVVPAEVDGLLTRNDEQPQVGVTPGFETGNTSFVFDGTETSPGSGIFKPDYTNWEIVPSELTGRGIMVRGVDYSWDKTTGVFSLLIPGDIFPVNMFYNIHFEPIQNPIGNSYPTINDFKIFLLTTDTLLDSSYFGNKIIVEGDSEFTEITLPDITTVPVGRRMFVESSGETVSINCVQILPLNSDIIKFAKGNIYLMPGETLSIYRFQREANVDEWRVSEADGNFKTVGQSVSDDSVQADVFNKHLYDGSTLDIQAYSRLYYDFVMNLPLAQVCNFADWNTGNNKYLFSRDNGSGQFKCPDRRNLYERNNNAGKAGDFLDQMVGSHVHEQQLYQAVNNGGTKPVGFRDTVGPLVASGVNTKPNSGTETRPVTYLINKYFLI